MRQAEIKRKTQETDIELAVNLDQQEPVAIETGVGFFDHMLTLFARHSRISLTVKAEGDLWVDSHHTVENVGIVLGQALRQTLGDKASMHVLRSCQLHLFPIKIHCVGNLPVIFHVRFAQ